MRCVHRTHTETSITGRICRRSFSPPILLNVSASALATVAFPRLLTMPIKAVYLVDTKEKCFQTAKGIQLRGRHSAIGIPNRRVDNARYPTLINLIFVSRTDVDSVIHDDLTTSEPILLSLIEKRSTFFRFYVSREIRREIRVRRGEREFTSAIYIYICP